ncbi:Pex12 amino terminal region-domain-containing protein [Auriculariales sp. MPI-PUGE-AT-0066]|nr:Pex12 amino terminal region-domain-containing protein [Auriculariales sp. MPI-PUGE-AT-0066]
MVNFFPDATQAQLIRANQRDLVSVSTLRDMSSNVLRPTMGTRWLMRWEKEVDLVTRLLYLGLTSGLVNQTLGEEYVDIWQRAARTGRPPSQVRRWALVLLYCLPPYLAARQQQSSAAIDGPGSLRQRILRMLPGALEIGLETNLALFYFAGTYYSLAKRVLGVRHISSLPRDPNVQSPSYALLGVLLGIRLAYRLSTILRSVVARPLGPSAKAQEKQRQDDTEVQLDGRPVVSFLAETTSAAEERNGEVDEHSALALHVIPDATRGVRRCVLCLEERTASTATECGHLFCWTCIASWGREKPECPLCRQTVELNRLWSIANL